jgi:hypothetical protein
MPDEYRMPPAERAAYANGWDARQAEINELKAEVERLKRAVRARGPWELGYGGQQCAGE